MSRVQRASGTDPEDRQAIVFNGWKNLSTLLNLILMISRRERRGFDILSLGRGSLFGRPSVTPWCDRK